MFDQLFGLILMGLGLKKTIPPTVLGDHDETEQSSGATGSSNDDSSEGSSGSSSSGSNSGSGSSHDESDDDASSGATGAEDRVSRDAQESSEGLRLMKPKFTAAQQEAFQKERVKREDNLKKVGDARVKKLEDSFEEKIAARKEKDRATKDTLASKVREFKDAEKKKKILNLSEKFQKTVTNATSSMQKKLQSMLTLLDKVSAASGALKAQGTDVSRVDADIANAQTKVSNAIYGVNTLVESLPTAFSVSGEKAAKEDVQKVIEDTRSKIEIVRKAFQEAHAAVETAVSDLEDLTDAVDVGVWPEKK